MSWDSPKNQEELVKYLQDAGHLSDPRVSSILQQVDRGKYCKGLPYQDTIASIGCNAIIGAPHFHAYALEKLKDHLVEGARALDVGAGSGYLTVCMALMVGASGRVVGVEHIIEILNSTVLNVRSDRPNLFREGILKLEEWDGRRGYFKEAPYDAIHVGASTESIPQDMMDQLAPGGRLVIPVGPPDNAQTMVIVDKDLEGRIVETHDVTVRCIPLTGVKDQMGFFNREGDLKMHRG